jgi:hypothetical protein
MAIDLRTAVRENAIFHQVADSEITTTTKATEISLISPHKKRRPLHAASSNQNNP